MNIRKIKLIAYIYIYFSLSLLKIVKVIAYKHIKNLHTVCSTSNHIGKSHVFYDVQFDHVMSRAMSLLICYISDAKS